MIGQGEPGVRYAWGQDGRYHLRMRHGRTGWWGEILGEHYDRGNDVVEATYLPRTKAAVQAWGTAKLDEIERRANRWQAQPETRELPYITGGRGPIGTVDIVGIDPVIARHVVDGPPEVWDELEYEVELCFVWDALAAKAGELEAAAQDHEGQDREELLAQAEMLKALTRCRLAKIDEDEGAGDEPAGTEVNP